MSNALHSTENVARMRACSALVHSTRARAAPPLSPRPRHTSAAMHGCAQTAACRALAANGVASPLLSACSSISAHAICRAKRAHVYACSPLTHVHAYLCMFARISTRACAEVCPARIIDCSHNRASPRESRCVVPASVRPTGTARSARETSPTCGIVMERLIQTLY